jgi:hypothetical protein
MADASGTSSQPRTACRLFHPAMVSRTPKNALTKTCWHHWASNHRSGANAYSSTPVADIAVLGAPDNQVMSKQADAYEALVEAATALTVAEPPSKPIPEEVTRLVKMEKQIGATGQVQWADRQCPGVLLSLNNQWFPCMVRHAPNGML